LRVLKLLFLRATAATAASTAVARLSHCNSVRPSDCRLSHGWISQKRCKLITNGWSLRIITH